MLILYSTILCNRVSRPRLQPRGASRPGRWEQPRPTTEASSCQGHCCFRTGSQDSTDSGFFLCQSAVTDLWKERQHEVGPHSDGVCYFRCWTEASLCRVQARAPPNRPNVGERLPRTHHLHESPSICRFSLAPVPLLGPMLLDAGELDAPALNLFAPACYPVGDNF